MNELEIVITIAVMFGFLFLSYRQWTSYYHADKRKNEDRR